MNKKMTFVASGDSLIVKHIPKDYPGFSNIKNYINRAEAKITNLETTLTDGTCFASSYSGGTWVTAPQDVLKDLEDYGFNLYGFANNHTMDYSYEGLISTKNALKEEKLVNAGAGMNLFEASRPGIIELPSARVGLIAISSTFNDAARAGIQSESMPGRPGLNPLRFHTVYKINKEHMNSLKEIAKATLINAGNNLMEKNGFKVPPSTGKFEFGSAVFEESEEEGRFTECNKTDLERTVKVIKDTLKTVDYVVVMVHSHEMKGETHEEADYFLEEFAHACIDAGACAIIGGGTHQLKGIEIYKNKPVFYSLGNFIFQNEYVRLLPPDFMEKYKLPLCYTAAEGISARAGHAKGVSMHNDLNNFYSVLPYFEMKDEECVKIELMPVSLGFHKSMNFKNIPYEADESETEDIFEYLQRVSKPYGTKLNLQNNRIIIDLK